MDPRQSAQHAASQGNPAGPGEAVHPQVTKYFGLLEVGAADRQNARAFWAIAEPHMGAAVGRFYEKLRRSEVGSYISDDVVERLMQRQIQHWARLFASRFDEDYVLSVQRVGMRHRDIGLGTAWFVAGYMALKMEFIEAVLKAEIAVVEKGRILKTVEKYVALDMSIALAAYEDTRYVLD